MRYIRRIRSSTPGVAFTSGRAATARAANRAGLAVGGAGDDQPMDVLERPAASHKFACKPVEQLGVRRRTGTQTEVARRLNEAPAEVVHPETVDHHSRRQRIFRVD